MTDESGGWTPRPSVDAINRVASSRVLSFTFDSSDSLLSYYLFSYRFLSMNNDEQPLLLLIARLLLCGDISIPSNIHGLPTHNVLSNAIDAFKPRLYTGFK